MENRCAPLLEYMARFCIKRTKHLNSLFNNFRNLFRNKTFHFYSSTAGCCQAQAFKTVFLRFYECISQISQKHFLIISAQCFIWSGRSQTGSTECAPNKTPLLDVAMQELASKCRNANIWTWRKMFKRCLLENEGHGA